MPLFRNKIFIFVVTRYATYGLQFVLSIIIATKLGPYYLGVYGMIQLILSYFGQINFGIPHSLNVFLVHNKNDKELQNRYISNSFVFYFFISLLIIIGSFVFFKTGGLSKGENPIDNYFLQIIAIAILTYLNSIITTVIRFRNQINLLSVVTSIQVLLNLAVVGFFNEEDLVVALTFVNLASCIIIFLIGYIQGIVPTFRISRINSVNLRELLNKGFFLFLYNSCFYFILISIRTIISGNYKIEEFGYFTFSYTIANAVMLLLDALASIAFPKAIDKLSGNDKLAIAGVIDLIRKGYTVAVHLLLYVAMILFPLIVFFMPKYSPALSSMNMIAIAILINSNNYGYSTLLIAQNKEKLSAVISMIGLVITIAFGLFLVNVLNVEYQFVIVAMLIANMLICVLSAFYGDRYIYEDNNIYKSFFRVFPIKMLIPYISALVISLFEIEKAVFIPLVIFLFLNYKDVFFLKDILVKLLRNPSAMDV